jgi:hypothetical protein
VPRDELSECFSISPPRLSYELEFRIFHGYLVETPLGLKRVRPENEVVFPFFTTTSGIHLQHFDGWIVFSGGGIGEKVFDS